MKRRVGIIGARGYVGRELSELVRAHEHLELELETSRSDGASPQAVAAAKLDAYFLALPNGATAVYADAIARARPDAVVIDLSADHRFNDGWVYGQPERRRSAIRNAKRIANPGCYATAAQLALLPLVPLLDGPAAIFGVSGYSGAGTTPSPKNDPNVLHDNLLPYALVDHVHEREVSHQLGCRVFFSPHVAPFFRGITVTVSVALSEACTRDALAQRYEEAFRGEPLVRLSDEPPLVRDIQGKHHVEIGGLSVAKNGHHAVLVATIDNLLGGAATQALRNLNLAFGFDELGGINHAEKD
jgi:N-acetyl-gamma-glutamyl-phosphate reductase